MGIRWLASLAVALALLVLTAASAHAATFTVDDTGDAQDALADGACATVGGVCTLRAAVEEANRTPLTEDQIGVSSSVTGTVNVGSTIPITGPTAINGCSADPNRAGACVEVLVALAARPGLDVLADDVRISGIAFRGSFGVTLEEGHSGLRLTNNWFGVRLDGTPEQSNQAATAVTLKGSGSVIGGTAGATGTAPADRNVFGSDDVKIRIVGGDDTTIQGNYFGLGPSAQLSPPGISAIRVERGPAGAVAEGTTIGGVPQGAAATSAACDGPCNVFSRHMRAVDLDPGPPTVAGPAGETTIQGNYFAVTPSGLVSTEVGVGVWVGGAGDVTVGGDSTAAGNRFGSSTTALYARSPSNLLVQNNAVGLNAADEAIATSTDAAIWLEEDLTSTFIVDNRIAGFSTPSSGPHPTDGIDLLGEGAVVVGNEIGVDDSLASPEFFSAGIYVEGDGNIIGVEDPGGGNVIRNAGDPSNADDAGVLIVDGQDNLVTGNRIDGTSGPAVLVTGPDSVGNEVAVNVGTANEGKFIELADGAHGGLQPPSVAAAVSGKATGTGTPGAAILVFSRPDAGGAGEVADFHGEATVAQDGRWTVPLSTPISAGRAVALQITSDGSSELSGAVALGSSVDSTPPQASVAGPAGYVGPGGQTGDPDPDFSLSANEASTFLCRLTDDPWTACAASHTTPRLADGAHTLQVIAIDRATNASNQVTKSFTVDTVPPQTQILSIQTFHSELQFPDPVRISLSSSEPGSTFTCRMDGLLRPDCGATWDDAVAPGQHNVLVAAVDAAGNEDPTPERRTFTMPGAPTPPPTGPSLAQLAALKSDLREAASRIRGLGRNGLLRRKRHRIDVTALTPGTFRLRATLAGATAGSARSTVLLTGTLVRGTAGSGVLTATVTAKGRRALRRLRKSRVLRLELSFTDKQGLSRAARQRIKLRPRR
ncbi:MAG TPA: hypothetical protein VH683_09405 [Thermoleophilaceae bacterium]